MLNVVCLCVRFICYSYSWIPFVAMIFVFCNEFEAASKRWSDGQCFSWIFTGRCLQLTSISIQAFDLIGEFKMIYFYFELIIELFTLMSTSSRSFPDEISVMLCRVNSSRFNWTWFITFKTIQRDYGIITACRGDNHRCYICHSLR